MSTDKLDEPEYPYGSQPASVLQPVEMHAPARPSHAGRGALRIVLWLAGIAFLLTLIAATPLAIIGYRGAAQASRIAQLEKLGCTVRFSRNLQDKSFRKWLEDEFGSESFGLVN